MYSLSPLLAPTLVLNFSSPTGYSYEKACAGAFAVHLSPGSSTYSKWLERNNELNQLMGLPTFTSMMLATFGGSHSSLALRACHAGLAHSSPSVAPSGRLDAKTLGDAHPGLEKALNSGLEWTVLHQDAIDRWPELATLGQKALNVRGAGDATEIEGLLTMQQCYAQACKDGFESKAAWDMAVEDALRAQPFWASWAKSIAKLAQVCSGELLQEARDFKSVMVKASGLDSASKPPLHPISQ